MKKILISRFILLCIPNIFVAYIMYDKSITNPNWLLLPILSLIAMLLLAARFKNNIKIYFAVTQYLRNQDDYISTRKSQEKILPIVNYFNRGVTQGRWVLLLLVSWAGSVVSIIAIQDKKAGLFEAIIIATMSLLYILYAALRFADIRTSLPISLSEPYNLHNISVTLHRHDFCYDVILELIDKEILEYFKDRNLENYFSARTIYTLENRSKKDSGNHITKVNTILYKEIIFDIEDLLRKIIQAENNKRREKEELIINLKAFKKIVI